MHKTKGDVHWFLPNRKRPFKFSTVAANRFIRLLAADGSTIRQCRDKLGHQFIRDPEVEDILDGYINHGFGNIVARNLFQWHY